MRSIHLILATICSIGYIVINVALLVVHVATTFFVYQGFGMWPAIVTFVTPPISEIWWAISVWWHTGAVINYFSSMIFGIIALYVIQIVLAAAMVATQPKEYRR